MLLSHHSRSESGKLAYFPYGTSKPIGAQTFFDTDDHRTAQRILRYLAKDVKAAHPNISVPPAWIQRQLIRSHICGNMKKDWRQAMMWTLTFIKQSASKQASRCHTSWDEASSGFIDFDAHCDLFPNADGYPLSDLRMFINACLQSPYLKTNT